MRDSGDLVKAIKRIVEETTENNKPTHIMYGKVISVSPLRVNVEQRMILDKNQLVLTDHLTRKTGWTVVNDRTYEVVFDNRLKVNDNVLLIRKQGGQKFIIIDKVVSA